MANCAICGKPVSTGVMVHLDCLPRWIPVTERMPNVGKNILIYSKSGGRAEGEYAGNGVWFQYRWSSKVKNVTHWMPLPETPKEENNADKNNT